MERDAAHHLDVEDPLPRLAQAGFAHGGERLEEQALELLSVLEPLPELGRLRLQVAVGQFLEVGLERGDVGALLGEPLQAPAFTEA